MPFQNFSEAVTNGYFRQQIGKVIHKRRNSFFFFLQIDDFISCCSTLSTQVRPLPRTPNKIWFSKPRRANWAEIHLSQVLSTAPRCRSFVAAVVVAAATFPALGFICPRSWSLRGKYNLNNTNYIMWDLNVRCGFRINPSEKLRNGLFRLHIT